MRPSTPALGVVVWGDDGRVCAGCVRRCRAQQRQLSCDEVLLQVQRVSTMRRRSCRPLRGCSAWRWRRRARHCNNGAASGRFGEQDAQGAGEEARQACGGWWLVDDRRPRRSRGRAVERRLLQSIHRTHGQGSGGEAAAAIIPESVTAQDPAD
jgi:hypothetical protein